MKPSKVVFYCSLFIFFAMFLGSNQSASAAMDKGPVQKLARGVVHLAASPFQIPKEVIETTGETHSDIWIAPFRGMTEGIGVGIYQMGRQGMSGLVDIVTFWTPAGHDWDPVFESTSLFPEM